MAKSSTSGQGRPKGAANKATREIKDIARSYGPQAIEKLWKLASGAQSEQAQVSAIKEILDRGYGKPHQTAELTVTNLRASDLPDDVLAGYLTPDSSQGTVETPLN